MLNLRNQTIYVALKPVDMRKSFDGLAAIVQNHFTQNPFNGEYFVFINRPADRIKILQRYKKKCGCGEEKFAIAEMPERQNDKSAVTIELIAAMLVSKFCDHSPIHRQ